MSHKSRLVALIGVFVMAAFMTGCPGTATDLAGTWRLELGSEPGEETFVFYEILKFDGFGNVTYSPGTLLGEGDWSVELRSWITGKYTTQDGNLVLDFRNASCEDMGGRVDVTGTPPEDIMAETDSEFQMLIETTQVLTLQPIASPYQVAGDLLSLYLLGGYERTTDNYDYSITDWDACASVE